MSFRSSRLFRRSLRRKPLFWLAVALLSFVVSAVATIQGCTGASYNPTGTGGNGYSTSAGEGGSDASVDVTPDGMQPPMKLDYSALCGMGCKPGSTASCTMTSSTAATSGSAASSSSGGGSTTTGTGGASSSTASASSGSGSSSASSTSSGLAPTEPGCQISADGSDPTGVCGPTGHSASGGPCQSASDCNEGLGCVAVSGAGVCRPYCCGSLEACGKGTFCTPLPMKERFDRAIPVCTPVTPCELFTGSCMNGETCTIVRADGTTSCAPKGNGKSCDPCPCGDGYMCSATGVCQKLCHTTPTNECGAGSTCQGGSANFPSGVGICVGGSNDCLH